MANRVMPRAEPIRSAPTADADPRANAMHRLSTLAYRMASAVTGDLQRRAHDGTIYSEVSLRDPGGVIRTWCAAAIVRVPVEDLALTSKDREALKLLSNNDLMQAVNASLCAHQAAMTAVNVRKHEDRLDVVVQSPRLADGFHAEPPPLWRRLISKLRPPEQAAPPNSGFKLGS